MAAGLLAEPGDAFGPCAEPCKHTDCAATRRHAARICHHCGNSIGYMTRFYDVEAGTPAEPIKTDSVHALCEELAIEREQKQRGDTI